MISCFKGETTSLWENEQDCSHIAVYTSTSGFDEDEVPKIKSIIESVKKYDVFKYAAYRVAFKLHTVRKASKLDRIDLSIANTTFKEFECGNNCLDETITLAKAHNLLSYLYTEAQKKVGVLDDPNQMTLLFLSFLKNAYIENEKPLLFIHLKIVLTLFSAAKLSEKFKHLFHYCSSGNTMSKENLYILMTCLAKMAELVGEEVTFGSHLVPKAIKHLVKFSKGKLTLKKFQKWILLEPQTLVWISTLHRVAASELTRHSVSCDYCLISPIIGFRYRCAQCINYNLCQNCFLHGCLNKRHKKTHPVQEFCHSASKWEETKAIFNAVKNNLPFARCPSKAYTSFDEDSIDNSHLHQNSLTSNSSMQKLTASYVKKELMIIIAKLEEEKRTQFAVESCDENIENKPDNEQREVALAKSEKGNTLNKISNLDTILGRLKILLQNLEKSEVLKENQAFLSPVFHAPFNKMDHYFESTPLNSVVPSSQPKVDSSQFSSTSLNYSEETAEKLCNYSTSLDFTNVLSSCNSRSLTDSTEMKYFANSSLSPSTSKVNTTNILFEMNTFSNDSSSLNLTEKIAPLDESKLSPLFLSSHNVFTDSAYSKSDDCNYSVTPIRKAMSTPSILKNTCSTFTINKNKSLEEMELELQAMLQHIEELLPQVSALSCDTLREREKVSCALSEMENSVRKLSHLSIALSTGSSDL